MNEIKAVKLRLTSEMLPVAEQLQRDLREAFWRYCDLVGFPVASNYTLDLLLDLRKDFLKDEKN